MLLIGIWWVRTIIKLTMLHVDPPSEDEDILIIPFHNSISTNFTSNYTTMDPTDVAFNSKNRWQQQSSRRRLCLFSLGLILFVSVSVFFASKTPFSLSLQSGTCLPPFYQDVLFEDVEKHAPKDKPVDSAWNSLLTPNGGFLINKDEEGDSETIGISMFHQLHCLQIIRVQIENLIAFNGTSEGIGSQPEFHHDHVSSWRHWRHCLEYIRQVRLLVAMIQFLLLALY